MVCHLCLLESTLVKKRRNLLLKLPQLRHIECLVPADIDEYFDAAIELQKRLRRTRFRLGSLQRREGEHVVQLLLVDQHIY